MLIVGSLQSTRAILLSAVIAVGVLVGGCDVFSAGDDSPAWVGNWEVVEVTPDSLAPPENTRFLYSIEEERIETLLKFGNSGCESETVQITNVDGNVITTEDAEGTLDKVRLEVSDDRLVLSPVNSESQIESITAESVDGEPQEVLNCAVVRKRGSTAWP